MKRSIFVLCFILCLSHSAWAADVKMTDLTEDTTPSSTDILWMTKDPGGTPLDRKVTRASLLGVNLEAILGLTFADKCIIVLTGAGTVDKVCGTAANQLLGMNAANTGFELKDGIAISTVADSVKFVGQTTATKTFRLDVETNVTAAQDIIAKVPNPTAGVDVTVTLPVMMADTAAAPTVLGVIQINTNTGVVSIGTGTGTKTFATGDGTDVNIQALNLISTGMISGSVKVITTSTGFTIGSAPLTVGTDRIAYGGAIFLTTTATLVLPAVQIGMSLCAYSPAAVVITVDPNASDGIRNGTATRNADGENITCNAAAGNYVCLLGDSADGWTVFGKAGTWTDQ